MNILAYVLLAICTLASARAHASPLFELTGGVGDQAGFGARESGGSAASAYFNPALLTNAHAGFYTGFFLLDSQLSVALDGRPGGDVPLEYRGATHADGTVFEQTSVPTAWLKNGCGPPQCPLPLEARPRQSMGTGSGTTAYQAIGLVVPLIPERLVLGFYSLIPLAQFTTGHAFFVDEREQFFTNSLHPELYADRLTAVSLAFGLGAKLTKRLSIGADVTLSLHNVAKASTFVGNADDLSRTLLLSTDVSVEMAFAPHFGIAYDITDRLHLAATLHTVERFDIVTSFSTFLPDGNKQVATRTAVHDYMPVRLGFGASCEIISDGISEPTDTNELALHAVAVLGFWSDYIDRQNEHPLPGYEWRNTVSVGVGARHSYGHLRTFLDAMFVPTPVPLQTGRTNYVDNDRISTGAGFDYGFKAFKLEWRVGAQAQLHMLMERYQHKLDPSTSTDGTQVRDEFPDDAIDSRGRPIPSAAGLQTNNPGWPGFSSAGMLFGGGVNLAVLL
jgi:long-chain fatty acid transport protein